jgi:HPt (histidine-containing phosphotransfer) domain-containing protein
MIDAPSAIYSTLLDDPDLQELVELFVEELPQRTAQLMAAKSAGDRSELGRYAHQLKGAVGAYGFEGVTQYAARLEEAARSDAPEEEIERALTDLIEICGRLSPGNPNGVQ